MTTLLIRGESFPLPIHFPSEEMTLGRFYEFCLANPDLRIERTVEGNVIIMPPTFSDTGNRNSRLSPQLANWADQDGTGEPFDSNSGFTLPNGAVRSPDAAWIKRDRWESLTPAQQASFAPICPDFVVELRSASNSLSTLAAKMQEYIDNGAILGWLIDRQHRTVHVYRPNCPVAVLKNPETVSGEPELPGFILHLAKIW